MKLSIALAVSLAIATPACTRSLSAAPASSPPAPSAAPPVTPAILAEPDRGAKDRQLDAGRKPVELFNFAGVHPGSMVAEIGAWEGYGAELLARAVGPDGKVYAVDPPEFDKYTKAAWAERSARPVAARIVRVARAYDDPFPPGTPPLDVAFVTLFYHDMVWLKVDRDRMNAALFRALKPGGTLVIVDHSAKKGEGTSVAKSLHRIEESVVVDEVKKAGFVLDAESDFLRHPEDPRDWSASDEAPMEKRGTSDRFALRFKKP
jgi:predicted methyltransferase